MATRISKERVSTRQGRLILVAKLYLFTVLQEGAVTRLNGVIAEQKSQAKLQASQSSKVWLITASH